jgi:hypothetical protein
MILCCFYVFVVVYADTRYEAVLQTYIYRQLSHPSSMLAIMVTGSIWTPEQEITPPY